MGKGERVTVTKAKDLPKSGMMRLTERGNITKMRPTKCIFKGFWASCGQIDSFQSFN